jgi:hypothetical protein
MQISKAAVTERGSCSRCKGKGFGGWFPENGRCYGCGGTGAVPTKWDGLDITADGLVAREAQVRRGTAPVLEILMVVARNPQTDAYLLTIFTRKLDGSVSSWSTRDAKKGAEAQYRAGQALQRDMTADRVAAFVAEVKAVREDLAA